MNITQKREGNTLMLALEGRLDTSSSPELETLLAASLDGVTELIFDFAKLEYLSSAGLRVILTCQKRMKKQGSMKLLNVNKSIKVVFDITGFSDFLVME